MDTQTILFQGDSITDCGRERATDDTQFSNPHILGRGYAAIAAATLLSRYPTSNLKVYNRGISGNRIVDLYARWKPDGVNLKPDLISILIGINDTWHEFGSNTGVEVDRFETVYRMLLEYTRKILPKVRLVICEPFCFAVGNFSADWVPDVRERQRIAASLANDFDAVFVPFQSVFDEAAKEAPETYWLPDGVHPSPAGHFRMAQAWVERVTL